MNIGQLTFLIVAVLLLAFTLGATIAWRLEGRRPLVAPLWLVITRNISVIMLAISVVTTSERPSSDVMTIDPLWWNLMNAVILIGPLVVFALELRYKLRDREST